MRELNQKEKIALLNKFASYRKRQGDKCIVLQSLPILGVQADDKFYSYDSIFNAIKGKLK